MNDLPGRKQNRLKNYDYCSAGAYFVTLCTIGRQNLFWNVGETIGLPGNLPLSQVGIIADIAINNIPKFYNGVSVEKYVIMPNHLHMILTISACDKANGRTVCAPTVSRVITQLKGFVTKKAGRSIWQRSFYDHIIRNGQDYLQIWEYINTNPLKWKDDEYFS